MNTLTSCTEVQDTSSDSTHNVGQKKRVQPRAVIEAWRREYNEERPKKGLGGLTPAAYARRLAETESRMTFGL